MIQQELDSGDRIVVASEHFVALTPFASRFPFEILLAPRNHYHSFAEISDQMIHGDGPMKAFTLRGIKDSPPYLHDGRLLTLEDTVEFFNLVLGLKLEPREKEALVQYMRAL